MKIERSSGLISLIKPSGQRYGNLRSPRHALTGVPRDDKLFCHREQSEAISLIGQHIKLKIQTHHLTGGALESRSLTNKATHRPLIFVAFESLTTLALHRAASDSVG